MAKGRIGKAMYSWFFRYAPTGAQVEGFPTREAAYEGYVKYVREQEANMAAQEVDRPAAKTNVASGEDCYA